MLELLRRTTAKWGMPIEAIVCAIGLIATALSLPGEISTDSLDQLDEARGSGPASDWHSPMLVYLWRSLLSLSLPPSAMLVVQQALYWGGAALTAGALARVGRRGAAWAMIAVALFPHFLFFNHYILKDTAHYSAMFMATGLLCRAMLTNAGPHRRWPWMGAGFIASTAAILMRVNGAFAVAPLAVVLLTNGLRLRWWKVLVLSVVASGALVLAVRLVNTDILKAHPTDVEQSLQLFDLAGIHYHSRDDTIWGTDAVTTADIDACYTSFYWDVFGTKGACGHLRVRVGAGADGQFSREAIDRRKALWLAAILKHPIAYAAHRGRHFNSAIYFAVPALHARFNHAVRDGSRPSRQPLTERDIAVDYVKRSFLIWPATWLVLAMGMLTLTWHRAKTDRAARISTALLVSGVAYGAAYAVIGVATDVRYFLWTNLATLVAIVIGWPHIRDGWRAAPRQRVLLPAGLALVFAIGMASRLLGIGFT